MDSLVLLLVITLVASAVIAALGLVIWAIRPDFTTYDVSRSAGDAATTLGGIPFYVKKSRHVHATSYLECLMELSVEADLVRGEGDAARREKVFSGTKTVRWPNHEVTSLLEKLDTLHGSSDPAGDFEASAREFRELREADSRSVDGSALTLESNSVEQVVHVDYSDPHFINSRRPRSGSSESTVEIGADGTLSRATAKAEDKTIAALAGMLPISQLAEKRLSPAAPARQTEPGTRGLSPGRSASIRVEITYEQKPIVVRHTLSEVVDPPDVFRMPPIAWPSDLGAYAGGYRRELAARPEPSEAPGAEVEAGSEAGRSVTGEAAGADGTRAAELADIAAPGMYGATRGAAPLPKAVYRPGGGSLSLVLESGHAHTGRYTLLLWDGDKVVHRRDDLAYEVTQPLGPGRQGRAIDCVASLTRLGDPDRYHLTALVFQDASEVGRAEASGEFAGGSANERITLFMEEA